MQAVELNFRFDCLLRVELIKLITQHFSHNRAVLAEPGPLSPHARAGLGIGYMPEDRGLVPELTVEEKILIPVWVNKALNAEERLSLVYKVLPELLEMRHRRASLLSGGQQKLVALARALAVGTRLLLLDAPFEGVAPALSKGLGEVIAGLKGTEVSVLIAQSDLNHSRKLVDREFVIERVANLTA